MIRKPVLLAVDDEPGMLALIERFAGPAGFTVVTHTRAGDAIARIGVAVGGGAVSTMAFETPGRWDD